MRNKSNGIIIILNNIIKLNCSTSVMNANIDIDIDNENDTL